MADRNILSVAVVVHYHMVRIVLRTQPEARNRVSAWLAVFFPSCLQRFLCLLYFNEVVILNRTEFTALPVPGYSPHYFVSMLSITRLLVSWLIA